ncbi:hypothetical protein ACLBXM_10225 [Xanthobacteraceae bacterium A53D]
MALSPKVPVFRFNPSRVLAWLRPPPAPARAAVVADEVRDDMAAVIYEAVFPHLSWGNATTNGRDAAYAGADAVLDVLRPHLAAGQARIERA